MSSWPSNLTINKGSLDPLVSSTENPKKMKAKSCVELHDDI